ncbi:DUF982 domain-containing protein [Mesorhizobium sp. C120A]|uniref:DUF982 domain-containing protein n=1 Tax=unclassified Mesorhizobium TaxID=325217 RepID=UPI0003CFF628|nr:MULTISPECIES: DUF982 domain-containing protein [unclassified Mesorhizobium]ESZ60695.1 hypothetical protein X728_15325 [Mesorhizobium sp. L103C120A0]WJI43744.1 DUF982 domain-containing protein [Mesorhizobium sp. C120A]
MSGFHSFSAPVAILWSRGTAHIGDVERALEEMQSWVRDKGLSPAIEAAYPICYGAIADTPSSTVEEARAAFIEAAKEAKVYREG